MENVLTRLIEGSVVVVPGDRAEVLVAVLLANAAGTFPSLAGIVLNGGFELTPVIGRLLDGVHSSLPIVTSPYGSYETTVRIIRTAGRLAADSERKKQTALQLFADHVDEERLLAALDVTRSPIVTPLMFAYELMNRARSDRKRIVLPEGSDDRILRAADIALTRGLADLTILGEDDAVRARAAELGLELAGASILSPFDPELHERFTDVYAQLRAHKGITRVQAADTVTDVSYFGTLMVHLGLADGMVSGAAHTTAHTIRPAFEIIKTKPGVSVVSSVFLMALADRVLVYGDCAVIPDPTADQLADIAVSSAATAAQFGIEPRVAMLSYSTGESGSGADVEKVREATSLVHERAPQLLVEGPIQYDAAADAAVAAAKLPGSNVAGRATVFIFPDLNTGNNTYKAVQRSAGAVAIGPVLQGLRKPINDLSRGALVDDIVNTIAITAIQAQS
jgi:phosphate acetyltransferase